MSDATPTNLSAQFPLPPDPFVGPDGQITRVWLYFLLALFNRTGGSLGLSSASLQKEITTLQNQTEALFVEQAMSDEPIPQPISPAALLALSLMDEQPPPTLNPILASLMVSDLA
jgi:hypothetical protein